MKRNGSNSMRSSKKRSSNMKRNGNATRSRKKKEHREAEKKTK